MKTVLVIQARVGSTRLPRKVLMNLGGQSVLSRVIDRLRMCQRVDEIVIATTESPADDAIVDESSRCRTRVVRGSEQDVLSRYHLAATVSNATEVIRVTSDCPLIDPQLVDRLVHQYEVCRANGQAVDYISNTHPRTFPHGLDIEMFSREALETAHQDATQTYEREHVTPYLYLHPDRFQIANLEQAVDQSSLRWTLDEPADLLFFEAVFRHFRDGDFVSVEQVLGLLDRYPELSRINANVQQKPLKAA